MTFAKRRQAAQPAFMLRSRLVLVGLGATLLLGLPMRVTAAEEAASVSTAPASPADPRSVTVERARTSIYIGIVTLTLPPLIRDGLSFRGTYTTKVFPYFFYNEHGGLTIEFPEDAFARLAAGESVAFTGSAQNTKGEHRRIEGRADPANAQQGRIKVRVFVTPKIELIFNTSYQFQTGNPIVDGYGRKKQENGKDEATKTPDRNSMRSASMR